MHIGSDRVKKRVFYTEAAFGAGLLLLAFGTALTAYGGFGISMVVAPAYILHLWVSEFLPFFSFGMAEYGLQALVLALLMLTLRKVKAVWFLSFLTAVVYGLLLDGSMLLTALLPSGSAVWRAGAYLAGVLICAAGISLLFRTYLPPEAYELFMKEIARKLGKPLPAVKTVYDCTSMAAAIAMSLLFFGGIRGIGVGSVICAFINGALIRAFTGLLEKKLEFRDRFALRPRFEESEETV